MINQELAKAGKNFNRAALVQQGGYQFALANQYAAQLARFGWGADRTKKLGDTIAALVTQQAVQTDAIAKGHDSTTNEVNAIYEAKKAIRHLSEVAPIVLRENPNSGYKVENFTPHGTLGRNLAKISDHLGKVLAPVQKLDAALTPFFDAKSPFALFSALKKRLDAANAQQGIALGNVPEATLKIYELKGLLAQLIGDLNRIGRGAFDGQAEIRAKFNKDLMLHAHRGTVEVPPPPPPAPVPA